MSVHTIIHLKYTGVKNLTSREQVNMYMKAGLAVCREIIFGNYEIIKIIIGAKQKR